MSDKKIQEQLKELFTDLPKPIQNAIASADVEKQLREIATAYKLHLDKGQLMENEVLWALFGIKPVEDLEKNIKSATGVSDETATQITADISRIVFEPIRQELERELEHPDAKVKEESGVEEMRTQMLSNQPAADSASSFQLPASSSSKDILVPAASPPGSSQLAAGSSVIPATPPPAPTTEKAIRMPASGAYKPGEASAARKDVHDDPYREPPA